MGLPLSIKLAAPALNAVRSWVENVQGVPWHTYVMPTHLKAYGLRYSAPELASSLYVVQHDEKDVHRKMGPKGLQDWGDGVCQANVDALSEALAALSSVARALAAAGGAGAAEFAAGAAEVLRQLPLIKQYQADAAVIAAGLAGRTAKLRTRLSKQTDAKQVERLSKHIAFNDSRTHEVAMHDVRVMQLVATSAAMPSAPTQQHTLAWLAVLIDDVRALLEAGFSYAHVPTTAALTTRPSRAKQIGIGIPRHP